MGIYEKTRKSTKDKIIQEFWKLYNERGISRITVRDIVDCCHIHRSTFYMYFTNVNAVLEEIEDSLFQELKSLNLLDENGRASSKTFWEEVYKYYHRNKVFLQPLLIQGKDPVFKKQYVKTCLDLLAINKWEETLGFDEKDLIISRILYRNLISIIMEGMDEDSLSWPDILSLIDTITCKGTIRAFLCKYDQKICIQCPKYHECR